MGLALAILAINVAGLIAIAFGGEASGHATLAVVGLGDVVLGGVSLVRALRDARGDPRLGRPVRRSVILAPGLLVVVLAFWPDPLFAAARVVTPDDGQAIGGVFVLAYAVLWAVIAGVAITRQWRAIGVAVP
jgi:hypothetical protein